MKNWPIYADGVTVNVSAASAVTDLGASAIQAEDVMVDNPGPLDVYVRAGIAGVTATLTSVRVPAGSMQPFRKGEHQYLALRTASGNQSVVVHVGAGS